MTDYRQVLGEILEGLLVIPVPMEVNIESWSQFVTDRQELIDELALLVDSAPTLVHGLLMGEFADDLEEVISRVDDGVTRLKFELSAVSEEMEVARKSAVLVQQQKRAKSLPGELLGVG